MIACGWYCVGRRNNSHSWIINQSLQDAPLGDRYASSFFWSIAQFTGSSSDIPHNTAETVFGSVILLLAFIVSISIVSSLTTLMTRLQLLSAQTATQLSVLTRYLIDHRISSELASRVQRNANHALYEMKRNTPESGVELLGIISQPLKIELRHEVYSPILIHHPFFFCFNRSNMMAMRQVCYYCIEKVHVSKGDVIFSHGELQNVGSMFFILNGTLKYSREGSPAMILQSNNLNVKWLNEAVLWTSAWVSVGACRAQSDCEMLFLRKGDFIQTCTRCRSVEFYPYRYAACFVHALNSMPCDKISEISEETVDLMKLVHKVFPLDVAAGSDMKERHSSLDHLKDFFRGSTSVKVRTTEHPAVQSCHAHSYESSRTSLSLDCVAEARESQLDLAD